jgi:hypothetical protein
MPSRREWPPEHTKAILDFIDKHGDTLATSGPRRRSGYLKLTKRLNAIRVPRPRPAYSIDDITAYCMFLINHHSAYQGPKLKEFFQNGRRYLLPPYGNATPAVVDAVPEAEAVSDVNNRIVSTLLRGLQTQLLYPLPRPRPRYTLSTTTNLPKRKKPDDRRRTRTDTLPRDTSASSLEKGGDDNPSNQSIHSSLEWWRDLTYLRSGKCRISMQDISPAMIRLKRDAGRAVNSLLERGQDCLLPQPDINYIKLNCRELAELILCVVHKSNIPVLAAGKISNPTLLRSLIARAIYKWVFVDPFPVLGTEGGGIWDDLKAMLQERGMSPSNKFRSNTDTEYMHCIGGDIILPDFENLRSDLQFRLSEKPQLVQQAIPARADQLARRLAYMLEPLLPDPSRSNKKQRNNNSNNNNTTTAKKASGRPPSNQKQFTVSKAWVPNLQKTFFDALQTIVKLRQREVATEFFWPQPGAVFDDLWMQAENNGTKHDFERLPVLLTLMPAAFSRVPGDYGRPGEMTVEEDVVYYKATVVLDMGEGFRA